MKDEFDPIDKLLAKMKQEFSFSEQQVEQIEAEIKQVVLKAAEFAQASPEPDAKELYTDILIDK